MAFKRQELISAVANLRATANQLEARDERAVMNDAIDVLISKVNSPPLREGIEIAHRVD